MHTRFDKLSTNGDIVGNDENVRGAFRIQAQYCAAMEAPIYAAICNAIADGLTHDSAVGARVLDWAGEPTRDALPLRLMGGLHALVLAGADAGLAAVFAGAVTDPASILATIERVLDAHRAVLMPWLDGPPQTNEAGRSAALMTGLLEIARLHGPRVELLEIGSSAGLNLLIDRYRFDLGGTMVGPVGSPVTIRPVWSGPAPEPVALDIVSVRGSDIAPMDATDPAVAARLAAYVWPEAPERLARLRAGVAMLGEKGVALDAADAADWVEARLAEPQEAGVTRVLMHSVVWQYLPEPVAARVREAMATAGAGASAARPLGWVAMEPDRSQAHQVVQVRSWPGDGDWRVLATAHAHAAWVRYGVPEAGVGIELPAGARVTL